MTIKVGSYIIVTLRNLVKNQRGTVIGISKSTEGKEFLEIQWDTPTSAMPDKILKSSVKICKDNAERPHQTPVRAPRSAAQRHVDYTIRREREEKRRLNNPNTSSETAINLDAEKYEVISFSLIGYNINNNLTDMFDYAERYSSKKFDTIVFYTCGSCEREDGLDNKLVLKSDCIDQIKRSAMQMVRPLTDPASNKYNRGYAQAAARPAR
jgi:hypothetical protein